MKRSHEPGGPTELGRLFEEALEHVRADHRAALVLRRMEGLSAGREKEYAGLVCFAV